MPQVRDALRALEQIAPSRFALGFDKIGLQVGDACMEVRRAVVSLDRSQGAIAFTREADAQLLLAHHPLLFHPLTQVLPEDHVGGAVTSLVVAGTSFIAAHTNWDAAMGGINDTLATLIGLQKVRSFGMAADVERLKLVFFCPRSSADAVIDAAAAAGAGVIGSYGRCAFVSDGQGTFFGGEGSRPVVGQAGRQETVEEVRVEMVLPVGAKGSVLRAVRDAHPYEEPAIDLVTLSPAPEQPLGRLGALPEAVELSGLCTALEDVLDTRCWAWGDPKRSVRQIAVVGGSADDEWRAALRAGADVLVTGEVRQHVALEAEESGLALIAAGHYATEQPGCAALRDRMAEVLPEIEWLLFTPPPGRHGRPLGRRT